MSSEQPAVQLRQAQAGDCEAVADIWYRGWCDGHVGFVPDELAAARTEQSFHQRAPERLGDTTVAEVGGSVAGFIMVVGDEVEQVYVSDRHRGGGVARALIVEAERQVAGAGYGVAWLAVVAGNARARRFYQRSGWADAGLFDYGAADQHGPITVPCHRYEKSVADEGNAER